MTRRLLIISVLLNIIILGGLVLQGLYDRKYGWLNMAAGYGCRLQSDIRVWNRLETSQDENAKWARDDLLSDMFECKTFIGFSLQRADHSWVPLTTSKLLETENATTFIVKPTTQELHAICERISVRNNTSKQDTQPTR